MKFGLNDNALNNINGIFETYLEVKKVILYGSRAKNTYKPGSDIDLTFYGESLDLTILNKIALELDDLLLPYTFDLSIYKQIDNLELQDHIQRVGKIFYERI